MHVESLERFERSQNLLEAVGAGAAFVYSSSVSPPQQIIQLFQTLFPSQWRGQKERVWEVFNRTENGLFLLKLLPQHPKNDITMKNGHVRYSFFQNKQTSILFYSWCRVNTSLILQTSDSVTLDLLTYADLELLRNRKAGVVSRPRGLHQASALTAKRYLILIYTVEFDRWETLRFLIPAAAQDVSIITRWPLLDL